MNWIAIGQMVENLKEYLVENEADEQEYPKTYKKIMELTDEMLELMDEPID